MIEFLTSKAVMARVRASRREQCSLQREFAASLGITQSAYSRLELGQCKITVEQLSVLANLIDVTPSELVDGLL